MCPVTVFLFQQLFNRRCNNSTAAVDTFGFEEKHLILDYGTAGKVVLSKLHNTFHNDMPVAEYFAQHRRRAWSLCLRWLMSR